MRYDICVLGLGYIGLPTASIFATKGKKVLEVDVVPRVVETINRGDIHIEEPDLNVLDRARFALSDSGGLQEEAPSLGKPVLVMRTTTERPEGVTAGTCRLVGTDPGTIVREASLLLEDEMDYGRRSNLANPYGDGQSAQRIVEILTSSLTSTYHE